MRALLVAIGNPLRGEDGIAHRIGPDIARGIAEQTGANEFEWRPVIQLVPEIAAEIASFDAVAFLDADATVDQVTIEPVAARAGSRGLTHVSSPEEIVSLARALYGFAGCAMVCRIPARDFSPRIVGIPGVI